MYTNIIELNLHDIDNNLDKFFIKKYTFNNNEYNIIKYNKEELYKSKENIDEFKKIGNYRSVVIQNNKVLCYSPGKSIDYEKFVEELLT